MRACRNQVTTMHRARVALAQWLTLLSLSGLLAAQGVSAQSGTLTVQVDRPGALVPATLFGLFFEDINFGADGGLYPERVKNRSFEFPEPLMGWVGGAGVEVVSSGAPAGTRYVRLAPGAHLISTGFRGIGLEKGAEYTLTFLGRGSSGSLKATLGRGDGTQTARIPIAQGRVRGIEGVWKRYTLTLRPNATVPDGWLILSPESGQVSIDAVSLYPKRTFKNRKNGLRPDLVQLLADLKPGFLRFPGGCIVEGRNLEQRYQWKTTVGKRDERRLLVNRWNSEFRHRPTPDYYQSFGLGFYEYFQLSEDIGAEPLPILNCGMACQFNTGELVPLNQLDPYIQDALDLIEFANGPVSSKWGALRAEMGHPAPFELKMLGVGNEQWGPQYIERYRLFARILKAKHPEITLISSAGPSPDGERFDFLWGELSKLKAEVVDEHYYAVPKWFRDNVGRYDAYPRTGPKVFAGEYAAQSVRVVSPDNRNNWECALSEAAFVTGLERNADVVVMSSYAPLLAHVDAWQWTPNLIWFDNLRSYGTPNYYVQKLFSTHRGTAVLPVSWNGSAKNGQEDLFTSASTNDRTREVIVKLVNYRPSAREVRVNLAGAPRLKRTGHAWVLSGPDLKAENSLEQSLNVAPVRQEFVVPGREFSYTLAPNSLTVLRIGAQGR